MSGVYISPGNRKMGSIPSVSVHPTYSCSADVGCRPECYALRMIKFRKNIGKSWNTNSEIYQNNPTIYFASIEQWLHKHQPKYFRWHVGGDIPNEGYFLQMVSIALRNDQTKFVAFTKKFEYAHVFGQELIHVENLRIMLSAWPKESARLRLLFQQAMLQSREMIQKIGIAWLHTDPRVATDSVNPSVCPGSCSLCHDCWSSDGDVILHKH